MRIKIYRRMLSFMGIGTTEILVILLIVAVLFGARKLPELGKGIGEGIRNFRKSLKDENDSDSDKEK
ncbi:MAG: twin-arginine translocase TatA/TatE family subunit [bacterium]